METGGRFFDEYLSHENLFVQYFTDKLTSIEKYKEPGNLLDLGCGPGTFLRVARGCGWKVTGVELSAPSIAYARQTGLQIEAARIEDITGYARTFDAVSIFQTIEHMEDPLAVLTKAREMLRQDGILVISTPNRKSLAGRLLGKRWFGFYNDEHLFFFDQQSFEALVRNAGFEILSVQIDSGKPLTVSWVLIRLADYYYNHRRIAHRILNIFKPVARYLDWIKLKEPMVDLIIIARAN